MIEEKKQLLTVAVFVFLVVFVPQGLLASQRVKPRPVDEPIRSELNQVLETASRMHMALFNQD